MKQKEPKRILATDCGSTTTKAILIEKKGEEYRLIVRGEAPTTVEAPFEDVTRGVLNSVREVEELSSIKLLDGEDIIKGVKDKEGVDLYVSTSSAGGGLQMMVAGVVLTMTAESAARAALGAGAIHTGLPNRPPTADQTRLDPMDSPPSQSRADRPGKKG